MFTLQDIVNACEIHGGFRPAARALGIPESTVRRKFKQAQEEGIKVEHTDAKVFTRELNLRDALDEAKRINRSLARKQTEIDINNSLVSRIASAKIATPSWKPKKFLKNDGNVGTPTLFLSDWHYSEVVDPAQIGNINSYNTKIAKERLHNTVNNMIDVYKNHLGKNNYPGLILALGGDMFSGDIHAELKETNESPSLAALFDFAAELKTAIKVLKSEFGKLFIPCVAGNHGRLTHKPQFKNAAQTNIDWALYRLLSEQFKDDPDVSFYIPTGPDALYKVHNVTYCLTHGDKLGTGGGGGNIGAFGPIIRGADKAIQQYNDIGIIVDCVIMGHWHQYIALNRFIVNGAGKGADEYSMGMRFKPDAPIQASWLTHPEYGITIQIPIFCDTTKSNIKEMGKGSGDWVSVFG